MRNSNATSPDSIIVDPKLISAAIDRAVASAVAITESKMLALNVRMDGIQKASDTFREDLTRVPTQLDRAIAALQDLIFAQLDSINKDLTGVHYSIDHHLQVDIQKAVAHLKDLMTERFTGVAAQFAERDTRNNQRTADVNKATDSALAAAKESTNEIKTGFTKQIDALHVLLGATAKSSDDKIDDIKGRLTTIEARTAGINTERNDNRIATQDTSARMFSIIAIVVSVFVGIGQVYTNIGKSNQDQVISDTVNKIQEQQLAFAKGSARNPVEKTDVELLSQRLDSLSRRLDSVTPAGGSR